MGAQASLALATSVVVHAIVLAGCAIPGPTPFAGAILVEAGISMEFAGEGYEAFGAQSEPPDGVDDFDMIIPLENIEQIGFATETDPLLFPDRAVFRIRNVAPRDAVVMFDRSTDVPGMLVFTRDGTSPTVVPGLCDYYTDPSLRLCHPAASPS